MSLGGPSLESAFAQLRANPAQVFLLDGGTGEELFLRGVPDDRKIWSATAVVHSQHHAALKQVHQSFLQAGADAITTNSYSLIPSVGFTPSEIRTHCATAGRLAREAVTECTGRAAFVMGSLGPLVESYRPDLIMQHAKGVECYEIMIGAMDQYVDAFLAETLSSVEESMQPVDALVRANVAKPLLISYTLNPQGELRSGESVDVALPRILQYAKEKQVKVLAILFNCCEPEAVTRALQTLNKQGGWISQTCLLGAYANRLVMPVEGMGQWTMADSDGPQALRHDVDPNQYCADFAVPWARDYQVKLIGGCCGITPAHIAKLKETFSASAS